MKLKVNNVMGFFEVETVQYLPDMILEDKTSPVIRLSLDEEEEEDYKEMYDMLREDDRFIVYQGDTFGSSEVYIKEGTEVKMTRLSRYVSEGMQIVVGDFVFYIPNLAYLEGDLILTEEPYKWENFSDEELKERGVQIYVPLWKKIEERERI
jgi:hypothetical protein